LDVGSPKRGNVGWAILDGENRKTGRELDCFTQILASHLRAGDRLALGFECPLYVPRRADVFAMTDRRLGEEGLNWCGGPGSSVLATGLVQVNWVLTQLATAVPTATATTRWNEFCRGKSRIFCWEAFITSRAGVVISSDLLGGSTSHEGDALAGAIAFTGIAVCGDSIPTDLREEVALSLIGLHLLQTGLSRDMSLMSECCTVLKVRKALTKQS